MYNLCLVFVLLILIGCDSATKLTLNGKKNFSMKEGCVNVKAYAIRSPSHIQIGLINLANKILQVSIDSIKVHDGKEYLDLEFYLNDHDGFISSPMKKIVKNQGNILVSPNYSLSGSFSYAQEVTLYGRDVFECEEKKYDLDTLRLISPDYKKSLSYKD